MRQQSRISKYAEDEKEDGAIRAYAWYVLMGTDAREESLEHLEVFFDLRGDVIDSGDPLGAIFIEVIEAHDRGVRPRSGG